MKETTVVLTDQQAERLAEEERRHGVPAVVQIRRALGAYLGLTNGSEPSDQAASIEEATPPADASIQAEDGAAEPAERPDLWFIGLGRSGYTDTAARMEDILAEEWPRYILEDSFGGTRSWEAPERDPDSLSEASMPLSSRWRHA